MWFSYAEDNTNQKQKKRKTLQVFPATMTGKLNPCPANFTGMPVIKTQMASVARDFFFHNFIEMVSQNSTSDYVTGRSAAYKNQTLVTMYLSK